MKIMKKIVLALFFVLLVTALFNVGIAATTTDVITAPFHGVLYIHRVTDSPRPLSIHLIKIDLTAPNISFAVTPAGPHQEGDYHEETYRQTTREFLIEQNAQLAVNASFSSLLGDPEWKRIIRGVAVSSGDAYSPFEAPVDLPWPVLNISKENEASILSRASDFGFDVHPPTPLFNAVSGSERIITSGVITAGILSWGQGRYLHPRTAAGITADNKLIFATIDGRQPGFSEGMTTKEVAELLLPFGVVDAINLDGGGSTTMVIADPEPRVLNSPSDGSERANTTNIAIFAEKKRIAASR